MYGNIYNIFRLNTKLINVTHIPQKIVLFTMGTTNILLINDIPDTLPKNITEIGNVKRIQVKVVRTLSFRNFDLIYSKHLGRNINPVTDTKEKRKPTSYIKNGLSNISTVIQSSNDTDLLPSLPNIYAKRDTVTILDALTMEYDSTDKIENTQIQRIFNMYRYLPLNFLPIFSKL
jgi:hypothetical protein